MCFCFTSNEICHFPSVKRLHLQNGLLIFPKKETHSETQSWKSSRMFDEKSYHDNGKLWKSSRILRVNPIFFISLSVFLIFSMSFIFTIAFVRFSFFMFFHCSFIVLSLSFIVFHCLSLSFIVFHCLSLSFIVFHCLFLCWVLKILRFFGAPISLRLLLTILLQTNQFLGPSREVQLWALLFLVFLFVLPLFVFFLASDFFISHFFISSLSHFLIFFIFQFFFIFSFLKVLISFSFS